MPPPQVVYTTGMPVTVVTVQTPVRYVNHIRSFKTSLSKLFGGLQLLMAFISFGAATMAIVYYAANYEYGDGYWCGSFFLVAGSLALQSGRNPMRSKITAALVFALISLAFAATQFGLSLNGLIYNINNQSTTTYRCCYWGACYICDYYYGDMEAANGLLVAASGIEMLLDIGQIIICCAALCSKEEEVVVEQRARAAGVRGYRGQVFSQSNQIQVVQQEQPNQLPMQYYPQPPLYSNEGLPATAAPSVYLPK